MTPALVLAGAVVAGTLVPVVLSRGRRDPLQPPSAAVSIRQSVLLSCGMLLLVSALGVPPPAIGLAWRPPGEFLAALALSSTVVIGLDLVSLEAALRRLRRAGGTGAWSAALLSGRLPQGRERWVFLLLCLTGAFWEELCYRGVALALAPPGVGGLLAGVAASSALFGLHHWRRGTTAMLWASGYGVLFSVLYLITDSLPATMLAHAAGNLFVVFYSAPKIRRATVHAVAASLGI